SQVDEASKKDLEDLFQDFYDEYFDSSKIMKSSTMNVETLIIEEVFHEIFESFQRESSSFSLNDDVQQSPEEVILPQTNTQSIPINMIPNGDEASTSHNVFNERLEDAYFDAALRDADWVSAMQEELDQFARLKVWRLVPRPERKSVIKTKWIFKKKKDESSLVIRNKARLIAVGYSQQEVPTLMVEQPKLKLDLVGKSVDHTEYRSMIGLLMYVTSSRPDIMFATSESEYVAVSGCFAQVLWMRTQLTDYGFFYDKVPIYCDLKSAIAISCNPVQHTRIKHIDV
nr:retrovirus-related Pol polyprotein from transposon TNT 1-94 [Tanacetum cinerariifolium]